jgi:effector-binding domain-containing protein/uncharacterized protein YndB with AHSA1/START domain
MKIFKRLLLSFLALLFLLVLVSVFLPSEGMVTRSRKIQAPPSRVFYLINNLRTWNKWSPWNRLDTAMDKTYSGPESGEGASYTWKSTHRNVGTGSMKIVSSVPYDSLLMLVSFGEMGTSRVTFTLREEAGGCVVSWIMRSRAEQVGWWRKIPSKYFFLFMDKMIGPDFEQGLESLEKLAMAMPALSEGAVESVSETDVLPFHYICMEDKVPVKKIGSSLAHLYAQLQIKMQAEHLRMSGPPMAMYPGYRAGDSAIRVVAMFQLEEPCRAKCSKDMQCGMMPASHALLAVFRGPYERTQPAYDSLMTRMRKKKFLPAGTPREVYMNDPATVSDPSEYLTYIYFPVR